MTSEHKEAERGEEVDARLHDFNNLLGVILNYTTFARDASPEGSPVRKDLAEVLTATGSAAELIRQLLDFIHKIDADGAGQMILVVDDKPSQRRLTERILLGAGYSVATADSGDAALATVEAEGMPHMLLTDVVMPGMSGAVLGRRLREVDSGLSVAYMSGYARDAVARDGVIDRDELLLEKPFSSEELLRCVRRALAPSGAHPPAAPG